MNENVETLSCCVETFDALGILATWKLGNSVIETKEKYSVPKELTIFYLYLGIMWVYNGQFNTKKVETFAFYSISSDIRGSNV